MGGPKASGAKPDAVEEAAARGPQGARPPPALRFYHDGERIAVGAGAPLRGGAEVWLIRYDPRTQEVEVKDGDNRAPHGHGCAMSCARR